MMENKLVFCSKCINLAGRSTGDYMCCAEQNLTKANWYDVKPNKKCEELNANNDCSWFESVIDITQRVFNKGETNG